MNQKGVFQKIAAALVKISRPIAAKRDAQSGMSLIEVMVVLVIISLVTGVVGVTVLNQLKKAQIKTAQTQIRQIEEALELYKLSQHQYPSTAQGLDALKNPADGEQPFMKQVPNDPWGKAYLYISPGAHNSGGFDLMSYGPDKVESGDDVTNWK